ncbi:MAG: glycosyltransferase, partial [Planctomycetota bacterium]
DPRTVVLNGSGVPLDDFACREPSTDSPIEFMVITRMLRSKGIFDFCEAARAIHLKHAGQAKFSLLGPLDNGPQGIPMSALQPWIDEGIVDYLGVTTDVRPYLSRSSVIVLPSYYMEGTPRTLLEALASQRAIITTNSRGCRETVEDGKNGFLIEPKSPKQLEEKMLQFINDRSLIKTMGQKSRQLAESRYDVKLVNSCMLERMNLMS